MIRWNGRVDNEPGIGSHQARHEIGEERIVLKHASECGDAFLAIWKYLMHEIIIASSEICRVINSLIIIYGEINSIIINCKLPDSQIPIPD